MNDTHVLLIQCPDEKGLVHKITGALYCRKLNITENTESVDSTSNHFFMRTEFSGSFDKKELYSEIVALLPAGAKITLRLQSKRRLVLLATKESHCLGDLLLRHDAGELNAEIVGVISQYDNLKQLTERFGLPFIHIPVDESQERESHEALIHEHCQRFKADYLILAKYMRILSSSFIEKYPERIINIHHSFLPAFIGANPYKQAFDRGVKIIGATAHFVTEDLDEGPIITQSVIPVKNNDGPVEMAKAGREVEKLVLATAINLVLEDRVLVHGRRSVTFE